MMGRDPVILVNIGAPGYQTSRLSALGWVRRDHTSLGFSTHICPGYGRIFRVYVNPKSAQYGEPLDSSSQSSSKHYTALIP